MTYFDFNSASEQTSVDLIPKGTLVRVRMTIRPGGFDDASQGWTGGYATRNDNTGSVYLNCEFVVMEGGSARRKMCSLIGLHSPKGPEWANMGRTFGQGDPQLSACDSSWRQQSCCAELSPHQRIRRADGRRASANTGCQLDQRNQRLCAGHRPGTHSGPSQLGAVTQGPRP